MGVVDNNDNSCFVSSMKFEMKEKSLKKAMEKISNYSFFVTSLCMVFVYCILGQIKKVSENNFAAISFSLPSVSMSLIWNFIYFTIHF